LQDRLAENVNQRGREFVALRIMTCLGRRFQNGLRPATVPEISAELGVPSRLTQSVLRTLSAMRLVAEAAGAEAAFLPARPLEAINAHDILLAMRTGAGQELPMPELAEFADIYGEFTRIEQAERAAAAKVTLFSLANRSAPRLLGGETTAVPALPVPVPDVSPFVAPPNPDISDALAPAASPPKEPEPVKLALAQSAPNLTSTPAPAVTVEPPRRETARPSDHPDFPL
jgi:DNA-binding IscR family transcriptional regulator